MKDFKYLMDIRDDIINDLCLSETIHNRLSQTLLVFTIYCLQNTNVLCATKPSKHYTKCNPESVSENNNNNNKGYSQGRVYF